MFGDGLHQLVQDFVKDNDITCAETIYQSDRVIENAYELIHKMVEIVGYAPMKDDD